MAPRCNYPPDHARIWCSNDAEHAPRLSRLLCFNGSAQQFYCLDDPFTTRPNHLEIFLTTRFERNAVADCIRARSTDPHREWIAAMALRDQPTITPQEAEAPALFYPRMNFHDIFDYVVIGLGIVWHLSSIFKSGSPIDKAFVPGLRHIHMISPPLPSPQSKQTMISLDGSSNFFVP